ncbi:Mitochondrial-processing peptidase subunit alpha [Yarrowia sp. C11]|nr:Mitochondrial-processing peptidase subunit alpha [Yarrowia sp. C11]KAG5364519.1 Mitochondrial-processing peptidase subunit alpha [Yarrowia sp. E02]
MLRAIKRVPRLQVGASKRLYSSDAGDTKIHTLSNGLRVAVRPSPGFFSALGLYVDAGSRFEPRQLSGVSHIMDRLAFKQATQRRSADEVADTIESLGGNFFGSSARESIIYQATVFNKDVETALALLAESVIVPQITEEDVGEKKKTMEFELDQLWKEPSLILPEVVHMTAYDGTLGNPLVCPYEQLPHINARAVNEYRDLFYHPERFVLGFVGVPEETAVELAEKYFGWMKRSEKQLDNPASVYVGGEQFMDAADTEFAHIHVAYEGLPADDPDVYALSCLQTLLGGGGSFSAGGPGKGMYSRLYLNVLNRFGYIESCQAFNYHHSDSGIFGISASCVPNAAPYMADVIGRQLALTFTEGEGGLTHQEVERAKNQLRSSLLMQLESKVVQLDDMGRQIQLHGRTVPVTEMCKNIENLTVKDIQRVAQRVLTGNCNNPGNGSGKPTVVMNGVRAWFGDVELVLAKYGLGKQSKGGIHTSSRARNEARKNWW